MGKMISSHSTGSPLKSFIKDAEYHLSDAVGVTPDRYYEQLATRFEAIADRATDGNTFGVTRMEYSRGEELNNKILELLGY